MKKTFKNVNNQNKDKLLIVLTLPKTNTSLIMCFYLQISNQMF